MLAMGTVHLLEFNSPDSAFWFSPPAKITPMPVAGQSPGHGEIKLDGVRVTLERQGNQWKVGLD